LTELKVATGGVRRRRRHVTPPRPDDDPGAPENMSEEEYQRQLESSDPGEWPREFAAERRRRYMASTLSERSDPDEWMALHHGEPGSGLCLEGDETPEVVGVKEEGS